MVAIYQPFWVIRAKINKKNNASAFYGFRTSYDNLNIPAIEFDSIALLQLAAILKKTNLIMCKNI